MKKPVTLALALLAATALAGPLAGPVAAQSTLRVKPSGDVRITDPHLGSDSMARNMGYMVYDTLFAVDDQLRIRPQMAESHEVLEGGRVWRFRLREGLVFQDGSPVTAADVVASLRRWAQNDGLGQQLIARGAVFEAEGANAFTLTLNTPWGMVLEALGKPGAPVPFIMPERLAQTPANRPVPEVLGSGPYRFVANEWRAGDRLVFARHAGYRPRSEPAAGLSGGRTARFDRVEWLIMPDQSTAIDALRKGEIDIAEDIPADLLSVLRRDRNITVANQDELGVAQQIRLNTTQPPFNNPRLRQALLHAVNGQDFLNAVTTDPSQGRVCNSFYVCSSPFHSTMGWPAVNLDRARQLVRESGYDGTPVVFLNAAENTNINAFTLVADQLFRSIGLRTDVQAMDWATVVARRQSREPVARGGWSVFISGPGGLDMMEPVSHLGLRSNCDRAWFGWPCDEEIERLRAAFADTPDEARKREISAQIQARALETVPYIPIGVQYQLRAHRANLTGLLNPPAPVYWNVSRR
ncbi:ABC transporter substrate-binding protein [Falsiroseomonas stagni]|uniref:Peptide/nickel transport system substrate-binding protein n=1 Tax=Falsiroseomonas stagni DSM 19981 TaxID=1123062 RepID=A0A1I3XG57_9PROT|nr:ABC transporter substrate-binding protein [Falsiroseomonas stagni]SFK18470.1 peptide/nickel transport system substrate-binding protein [Falsiroseomonas stagni DSM 19981]